MGFPSGLVVKNSPANAGNAVFNPWIGKAPENEWKATPVLLPGKLGWTEELGGHQSLAHKRAGHEFSD